jgi:hypothetical protein
MLSRLVYPIVGSAVVAASFSGTLFALNWWSGNLSYDPLFTASIPSLLTARPQEPAPSARPVPAATTVATQETPADALPKVQTRGFQWAATAHLLVRPETEPTVVAGQPVLRLVASPQDGFHTLGGQFSGLNKNQVYRVTAWVKASGGGNIQLELGDQPPGQPPHHIAAIFSLSNHTVRDGDVVVKDGGIDQGPNGWQKIWLNLVTADGNLDVTLRPANGDVLTFKGDGSLGMILGGVEANPHG